MTLRRQMYHTLPIALVLILLSEANLTTVPTDSSYSLTNLDENREFPGPVAFPDHQVERKAQRSPSLRLRFGRRNDPDMDIILPNVEKRWFGDVHQKPIRSPSLRLRFGRRSDPEMPLHSDFDILMNELTKSTDYNGLDDEYDENIFDRSVRSPRLRWGRSWGGRAQNGFQDRVARSPRLRWGRSYANDDNSNAINEPLLSERNARSPLRLRYGRSAYDENSDAYSPSESLFWGRRSNENANADAVADESSHERNARSPLRLRFGRSAGGGEGNIPIPTIPPWILTAVAAEKNSPQASDSANKN